MTHKRAMTIVLIVALGVLPSRTLRADVRADERTKIEFAGMLGRMFNLFGGKSAREGVVATVAVKGNRKASINDTSGQIIDLSEEKIYDLDMKKKTYRVMTFAELRRQMEEAQRRAAEEMKKEGAAPPEQPQPKADAKEPQAEVDFSIRNTGQRKSVNGFDTQQSVATITVREKGKTLEQSGGLVMTVDMWLAPSIKQMDEIRQFDMKYAQKLYGPVMAGVGADQMAAVMAMYPMVKDALAKMNVEGGKIEGTPVVTIMTVDAVKTAEQVAAEAKQRSDDNKDKTPTSVGGLLGGIARRAAAKKAGADEPPKPRTTVLTGTTEILKVVSDVKPEDVAIPAGFKEAR